jgi:hypothetical protein
LAIDDHHAGFFRVGRVDQHRLGHKCLRGARRRTCQPGAVV